MTQAYQSLEYFNMALRDGKRPIIDRPPFDDMRICSSNLNENSKLVAVFGDALNNTFTENNWKRVEVTVLIQGTDLPSNFFDTTLKNTSSTSNNYNTNNTTTATNTNTNTTASGTTTYKSIPKTIYEFKYQAYKSL